MGSTQDQLTRWRREVRAVLPDADDDLVEELAQDASDRWAAAHGAGRSTEDCDQVARQEIHGWHGLPLPERRPRWRVGRAWIGTTHDVRYAMRSLGRRPAATAGAVLLAGLAIAANVAAFAIVYGILWRPLSYPDADRLTVLWQVRRGEQGQVSYPDFADVSAASVFDATAAILGGRGSLRVGEGIERINLIEMEPAGYRMLGATPVRGRLIDPTDAGKPNVMISHRLWRGAFASDPSIVGRPVWISGRDYVVVGVLQPGFDFELPIAPALKLENQDVWTVFDRSSPFLGRRDVTTYEALLRLAPGVTFEEADAAVAAISTRLSRTHAATNGDRSLRLASLRSEVVAGARRPLILVALGGGLTLLIALTNLTMLALMRSSERAREFAIRQALGAGVLRQRRQLMIESLAIAAAGAIVGFTGARVALAAVLSAEAMNLPRPDAVRLDTASVVFAVALALVIALTLLLASVRSGNSTLELRAGAKTAGRRSRFPRRAIVATELALAVVLSTGGVLFGLSFARLMTSDPGFDSQGALAIRVSAYAARYPTLEDVQRFFSGVIGSLHSMPDVAGAAAGSSLPLSGQTSGTGVIAEGQPPTLSGRLTAGWQFVSPGYFAVLGMPLREGRDFTAEDLRSQAHVTIINEELAKRLFPGQSAVGRRIGVGGGENSSDWHEIVGVVRDVRHHALDAAPAPRVYDLFGEHWGRTLFVVVRARADEPASLIATVRATINRADPEVPAFEATTLDRLVRRSAAPRRLAATLASSLAAIGVLLALVGVYAVSAASVTERTREIGIRSALGASPSDLLRMIAQDGAVTAMLGGIVGLAAAIAAAQVIRAQLFGVSTRDIVMVLPIACVGLIAAAVAAALPAARRAASADPVVAMRVD